MELRKESDMEVLAILISLIGITAAVVLALRGERRAAGQVAQSINTCQSGFAAGHANNGGFATTNRAIQ